MKTIDRRAFLKTTAGCIAAASLGYLPTVAESNRNRLNVLLITADDMNWDAPGCFGGNTPDITPNIDKLASEGISFRRAHVVVAVCQPSRQVLMTGRYPHRNGGMGFEPIRQDVPTLQEQLNSAGYLNGIMSKTRHLAPTEKYKWDLCVDQSELARGRNPELYYRRAKEFMERAQKENKPFFLMANSDDPHRPFSGSDDEKRVFGRPGPDGKSRLDLIAAPSRVYKPEEVNVPGFLPDLPNVRKEVAQYYSSVRRCDDTVGAVLRALKESGQEDNTLVMFISDNGMAFPFSKTNCYLNSTRTPWIVRWPGKVEKGTVNGDHFISSVDFMPTILEAAGIKPVEGMDGRSFVPLLAGKSQCGRERVFTAFYKTVRRDEFHMRCVQDANFGYIYNAWSDGKNEFRNESQSGLTWAAMVEAAESDKAVAERVKFFQHRVTEELYDFRKDPDALRNLADKPEHKEQLAKMRSQMLEWMEQTNGPLLDDYRKLLMSSGAAE